MRKTDSSVIIFALLVLLVCSGSCLAMEDGFSLKGNLFYRYQADEAFKKVEDGFCPTGSFFLSTAPDTLFPLATDSSIQNASFSIILFPGTLLKVDRRTLRLLGGRIQIKSDEPLQEPLEFVHSRFVIQFYQGEMLFEVTPLQHAWLAMLKTGEGWLKDLSRRVVVLKPGTEIEVPLFGETVVKERISSRWQSAPEVSVVSDVAAVFSGQQPLDETASATLSADEESEESGENETLESSDSDEATSANFSTP